MVVAKLQESESSSSVSVCFPLYYVEGGGYSNPSPISGKKGGVKTRFTNQPATVAMAISSSEAHYIIESCLANLRIDGRNHTEHRPYVITNRSSRTRSSAVLVANSPPPSLILSNGSSRIHLPGSTTDVLCSVKADLVHPSSSKPNEGVVELNVDLSLCGGGGGSVSGFMGGGGGSHSSSAGKRKRLQREEESQISSLLQRLVLPHAVNYEKLVVWPGKYVWRLSIDVCVLRCDGCVLDATSMGVREALQNTMLPVVQAVMGMEGGGGNNTRSGNGSSTKNDLMVDGDFHRAISPAGVEDCPLVVTVSVLTAPPPSSSLSINDSKRYRSINIVDARTEEEACASSRVCVSVDPSGMVCGVHTLCGSGVELDNDVSGSGGVSSSMPMAALGDIVSTAAMAAKNLYKRLDRESLDVDGKRNVSVVTDDSCGYGYLLKDSLLIQ